MYYILRQLIARGYWAEDKGDTADGSTDGGGGGDADGAADSGGDGDGDSGQHKPTAAEAKLLKEVMNKKARIKALEDEIGGVKKSLESFAGIDPKEVATLLKEREDAEKAALESKQDWAKLKERMANEHLKEKQTLSEQINAANDQVAKAMQTIQRLTIGQNFDTSKFVLQDTVLTPGKARLIYGSHFDVTDTGAVVGYDAPKGEPGRSQLIDGTGSPLPFEAALKRLIDADPDRDEILRSKRKPGAGSSNQDGKGDHGGPKKPLSARDKIALGLAQRKK